MEEKGNAAEPGKEGQQLSSEEITLQKIAAISEKVKAIQDSIANGMDKKKAEELLKPILEEYTELRKEIDKRNPGASK